MKQLTTTEPLPLVQKKNMNVRYLDFIRFLLYLEGRTVSRKASNRHPRPLRMEGISVVKKR